MPMKIGTGERMQSIVPTMLQRNMEVLPTSTVPAMMEPFLSYIWKPLVALI